jgi:4-amino-4-deoxy-L-arabinose transferase-like glycosyltransferase
MFGLAVLALVLRLSFVLTVERKQFLFDDTSFYHTIASQLAEGNGFSQLNGDPTAAWPPVWPFLLSLVYRVFGSDPTAGEVFNAFIGAATVPLLYFVARRALGRREAIFAGLFLALMPGQIFWNDVLLSETVAVFEVVGFMALMIVLPERRLSWAAIGVAVGIAALTRGDGWFLIVIPIAIAWRQLPGREVAIRTAIALGVAVLCVAPWTIRNADKMHAFVPVSNNFAATFWSGHSSQADGYAQYAPPELIAKAEALKGPQREIERSKILRRDATKWMVHHPLQEIELIPAKLLALSSGDSNTIAVWVAPNDDRQALSSVAQARLGQLADLFWFGLLAMTVLSVLAFGRVLWRNRILLGSLAFICVGLFLYGWLFYGNFRYHAPLEPLMILIAAPLVTRLRTLRAAARAPTTPQS